MADHKHSSLEETLTAIRSSAWLGPLRSRVLAVAESAPRCPRIVVRHWPRGIHVTLDGWDVGTIDGTDFACSTTNLEAAEAALAKGPNSKVSDGGGL